MTKIIVGPLAARPEKAEVGVQFLDKNSSIIYTFTENGWCGPEAKTAEPSKTEEPAPAPKKKTTRKKKETE